jgi:DNA-binding NtrC family response regulator
MSEKILVVDDDNSMLVFTQHALRDIGCHVVIMSDPVAALEYLGCEEVAVLVSDNNMPVMRGLELIEKANIVSPETVKIIMSGYTDLPMALYAINKCQVSSLFPSRGEKRTCSTLLPMPCDATIPSEFSVMKTRMCCVHSPRRLN